MSLKADSILSFNNKVSQYLANPHSKVQATAHSIPVREPVSTKNQKSSKQQTIVINLPKVIRELEKLKEKYSPDKSFGFHPDPKKESEVLFYTKASNLLQLLSTEKPSPKIAVEAVKFIELVKLIDKLNNIAKARSEHYGFNPAINEGDKIWGTEAKRLAEALIKNPDKDEITSAFNFLIKTNIIDSLENIAKEKERAITFGFRGSFKDSNEASIAQSAIEIATSIKINPAPEKLDIAVKFIELVEQLEKSTNKRILESKPGLN